MTQAKASIRPWKIVGHEPGWLQISDAEGNLIAILECGDGADEPILFPERANAEIIVTAVNERDALLSEVGRLREALDNVLQCFRNGAMPDRSIVDAAEAVLAKGKVTGDGK
jgi:hypothetical protein